MASSTVMLIEDAADDAELISQALADDIPREQILVFADGVAALDYLFCRGAHADRDPAELPAFILLDLKLPRLSGFDILKEIRGNDLTHLIPITVLSASDDADDVRTAAMLGANSYVHKAGDFARQRDDLARLARYWLDLNIPPPASARH
ncbi:MAG: response regulator [Sterolibacteriaceae bacterium MAG5]|nr:response regulator [Candidatus Nitricoxidireducens bremensis]